MEGDAAGNERSASKNSPEGGNNGEQNKINSINDEDEEGEPRDQRQGHPEDLLAAVEPEIEDDTEAAEALRANAQIKVGKVSKAARSINAQSVRKLVKRASGRHSGIKRGKPPRIPPGLIGDGNQQVHHQHQTSLILDEDENKIYAVQEADDEDDDEEDDANQPEFFREDLYVAPVHDTIAAPPSVETKGSASKEGENSDHFSISDSVENERLSKQDKVNSKIIYDKNISQQEGDQSLKPMKEHHQYEAINIEDDDKDIPEEVVASTMDVGRKLMGAIDPHNMLQVQRWRRKKRGTKKKRKSYVKGKVIDGRHELYTLSIAVMLGVRTSIARTNTIISSSDGSGKKILSPQDFMAEEKYEFAPKGSRTTPPHKLTHTFKFKDYAPVAFAYLRRMFGVNEFDFLLSVCGNANFIEFISNAKSGQFFFYSSDGKYMIKTMTDTESKFLRRILPHYFRHCTENPNSLIAKFLGMYRVKLYHLRRNVKFIIMNSVYYTDKSLQTIYDLKGSDIGRAAKPGQDVLKDNDLRKNLKEDAFSFSPDLRKSLRDQVESDCVFLRKMQIMDYSMLVGVHHIPPRTVGRQSNIGEVGFKLQDRRSHRKTSSRGLIPDFNAGEVDSSIKSYRSFASDTVSRASTNNNSDVHAKNDSTKRLIKDIRESAYSASNCEFAGLLEDDDDCSYLEGSENYSKQYAKKLNEYKQHPKYEDVELKKEQTIEQIYWPFHRFFDINGHRRMKPKKCDNEKVSKLTKAWKIPEFIPPLSDRKDGGFMMNISDMPMPMIFHGKDDMNYEGKIFYMGIIDILQQYNARKRVETRYRKVEVRGKAEPSCVSPDDYADRFISFFDEYSQKARLDLDEK